MSRYIVRKDSGSFFAWIVDTQHAGRLVKRYDIMKRGGWNQAERHCARLNAVNTVLTAAKGTK